MSIPEIREDNDRLIAQRDEKLNVKKNSEQAIELQQAKTALEIYLQERNPTSIQELKDALNDFSAITKAVFSDHGKVTQQKQLPGDPIKVFIFPKSDHKSSEVAVFISYDSLVGFNIQLYYRTMLPNDTDTPWYMVG